MDNEQDDLLDDQVVEHFDRVFGDAGGGDAEISDTEPVGDESDAHDDPVDEPVESIEDEPVDEPVEEPAATVPTVDDEALYFGGQPFQREDVEQLVTWAASLSPDQMQAIQYALNAEQPAPVDESDTGRPELNLEDVLDPELAKYVTDQFSYLNEEIENLRANQIEQIQIEKNREHQLLESAFEEARTGVTEKLGLSDSDAEALIQATNQSGLVAYLAQQKGLGAPVDLFTEALETTYWMTPEFRERQVAVQAETAVAEQRDLDAKKSRAAAVSGTSASAARSKVEPQTHEERFSAMVQEIAAEIGR